MKLATICTIIKCYNEAYYVEWVEHHLNMGFEHIYVYDNESPVRLPNHKQVKIIPFPGHVMQMPCYHAYLNTYADRSIWTAFIDDDEYICLDNLHGVLKQFHSENGISINWQVYGSDGWLFSPKSRLTGFRFYNPSLTGINTHVKTISQNRRMIAQKHPHFALYKNGGYAVDLEGKPVEQKAFRVPALDPALGHIKHYFTGSWEDWVNKCARARSDTGQAYNYATWQSTFNECVACDLEPSAPILEPINVDQGSHDPNQLELDFNKRRSLWESLKTVIRL